MKREKIFVDIWQGLNFQNIQTAHVTQYNINK